jgi:hypothetical protein
LKYEPISPMTRDWTWWAQTWTSFK